MRSTTVLAEGFLFGEGPRWHDDRLWVSDQLDRVVKSVGLDGSVREEHRFDDQPSGLGWLPDGRLLVVMMHSRTLLRLDPGGFTLHADLSKVAEFHCNDMVVAADGTAYVGNFGFDLHDAEAQGTLGTVLGSHDGATVAVVRPDGSVTAACSAMVFANGSVIDGTTLIVAETFGHRLTAFDIVADGSLTNRRLWAALPGRFPDGICLDADGAVWVADPGGNACLRVFEGGEVDEVIDTGQPCFACMLGGPDGRHLFMLTAVSTDPRVQAATRSGNVLVAEVDAAHAGLP